MEIDILDRTRFMIRTPCSLALAMVVASILLIMIGSVDGRAQVATPAPATCALDPRPITFIADLIAAPAPGTTPTPVAGIPDGTDVDDPEVHAQVVAVVETLIVCVNEGELLRSFALFDDEYLRRIIDPEGIMREDVAIELAKSLATPEPVESDDLTLLDEFLLVRELDDGTIVVVFQTRGGPDRDTDETQIDLLVLRREGDRWLIIDGLTDLEPEAVPSPSS